MKGRAKDSDLALFRRIPLPCGLHARQNPDTQEHDRANDNPVRWHMGQERSVNQSNNQNCKPAHVESKRHGVSLLSSRWQFAPLTRQHVMPESRLNDATLLAFNIHYL